MRREKVEEKIKTHVSRKINVFKNRVVYELTNKNISEPERLQMKIWPMRALPVGYLRLQTNNQNM